jgi:predicted CxxxxCH...CXXCH cytochrome family protein
LLLLGKYLRFSRAELARLVCSLLFAACFTPTQQEKQLLTVDDTPVVPAASSDAGAAAAGSSMDAGASGAAKPAADAATNAMPAADAATPAALDGSAPNGLASDAGSTADSAAPTALLFPSNCRAPWEDPTKYHPEGYGAAKVHGLESNLNKDDCASCHGDKLEGCANSPSCDNCHSGGHAEGWRKDCIYCHGGTDNKLGAPPRDMDGVTAKDMLSFIPHTLHVTSERHKAYDCDTCHKKYEDALDPGHMYDDTPEKAEVTFAAGLSKAGTYDKPGECGNLYCHGDGKQNNKTIKHTDSKLACTGCHSDSPSTGQHQTHSFGFDCSECHGDTLNEAMTITGPDKHVNGKVDTAMPENNMQWDGKTCTGTCHLIVYHAGDAW